MSQKQETNYRAWEHNAFRFLREKGLEREFSDWCGGFPCPVTVEIDNLSAENAELLKALRAILKLHEAHHNDPLHAQAREIIAKHEGNGE